MENKEESHSSSFLRKNKNLSVGKIRVPTDHPKDGEPPMKDYILIKLRSGEEIIGSLMSKNRNGLKVLRPMQIRQVPFMDHMTGALKAAVVLENWIGRTNENEVTIPNNWIGIKMLPSGEVIEAYERYMKNEDMPKESPKPFDQKEQDELKRIEEEMTKMMSEMAADAGITSPMVGGMDSFTSEMGKHEGKDVVVVNFVFPSKMFKNMMDEGILEDFLMGGMSYQDDNGDDSDEDDMEDDVDPAIKKKRVSDDAGGVRDSGKETFGNSFKDWSPDPKDYL